MRYPAVQGRDITQRGFTYVMMLIAVSLTGIAAAITSSFVSTQLQRERESELLFIGQQYQAAIESYYLAGVQREYPRTLNALLDDPRFPLRRHIRRLYDDPFGELIDEKLQWSLLFDDRGGIKGVASKSNKTPMKRSRFPSGFHSFDAAQAYSDWQFIYVAKPIQIDRNSIDIP